MKFRDKEYSLVEPGKATLKQSKLVILSTQAYEAYVSAKDEEEPQSYEKLKAIWKQLAASLVVNTDEVIQNVDNITPAIFQEVFTHFFPKSSEAPE